MTGTAYWLTRRRFVRGVGAAGLALLAGCERLPGHAPPARIPHVGFLQLATPASAGIEAFRQGLQELGYVEGENVAIEPRFAEGDASRLPAVAATLVQMPVDVILAAVTAVEATKEVTSTIPIVMVYPADPVANGLVTSLARPGGNVTGLTYFAGQLAEKRLEFLRDSILSLTRVAVLQEANLASLAPESARLESAARALGIQVQWLEVREPDELPAAFETLSRGRSEALLVGGGNWFVAERARIVGLAAEHQVPASYFHPAFVQAGGLMSYAANINAQFRRAAYYVDRILKGTKPADLPVEQPTTFEFILNLRSAQALGLTIPQHVLLQATEIVQ